MIDSVKQPYTAIEEGGIWHYPVKNDGSVYLAPIRLCDAFEVVGYGIGDDGQHYHIIKYGNDEHCIIARGDVGTSEGWRQLRNVINIPSQRRKLDLLTEYIQEHSNQPIWQITDKAGWHDQSYIMPNGDIIGDDQHLYFNDQISYNKHISYQAKGSLLDWQAKIGQHATGNSRICLVLGVAFAAPLLQWLNIDGGIIHLYGESSSGKTTVQRVAQSVWGHGVQASEHWNSTALAALNNATARNDGLLCMDEIGEDESGRNVERSIYSLANGKSRAQSTADKGNRPEMRFRVMTISTGETNLEAHLYKHGRQVMAGQLVRCPSIQHKLESHDGFTDMRSFANHLNTAVTKYYGSPGRAFIAKLLEDLPGNEQKTKAYYERWLGKLHGSYDLTAQSGRTARLFAAAMAAIEMACEWSLTGVELDDAIMGIQNCFNDWLKIQPDSASYEEANITRQARDYLQAHEAFFQDPELAGHYIQEFPGYVVRQIDDADDFYYVFPKVFKERIAKGFDEQRVKDVLHDLGWLQKPEEKRWVKQLYGRNANGSRKRLGRFLVFVGIEPSDDDA